MFRYNSSTGISSLDPAFARTQENIRAVNQLFNGLVQLDSNLNIQASIAKSWEISEGGTLYSFTLRNDVLFHKHPLFQSLEERKVNAHDFVYSFKRVMAPSTASDGAWIFNGTVADSTPFFASNDSTLHIRLKAPFAPFINMLSMAYCYVVPQEIVERSESFGTEPVGTGPFKFSNWVEGVRMNFIRNEEYFEATNSHPIPYLDAVSVSFIESKQTALLKFMQKDLDVFTGLESSIKDEILNLEGELNPKHAGNFELEISPFLNTEYLAFNLENDKSPFKNRDLRLAVNLAIDRETMVHYLRNSVGTPAEGGFTPKGLPSHYSSQRLNLNKTKAKELVSKVPVELRTFTLTTTKDYLDLCVLVQQDLRDVGLNVSVDVIPSSLLKQKKSSGDLFFFRSSWIADYPDGENYMACFYSKNKAPNGPNYSRFDNSSFDQLYLQLISTDSLESSYKTTLIGQMEEILLQEAPFVILFYDESIWLKTNNCTGLKVNALNHMDLRHTQLH